MSTNIRKDRGYRWEDVVTKRLNRCYSWRAFRLGFGSIALPDIIAVSNKFTTIEAIECKSGTTDYVVVKREQIERSLRFLDAFKLYSKRLCVLAIKFSRKRRLKWGDYEPRELKEYFLVFDKELKKGERAPDIIVSYNGRILGVSKGTKKPLDLPLLRMPFED